MTSPVKVRRPRTLSNGAALTLARLLAERGLSEREIDRGLAYVMKAGVCMMREAFELAMSRARFTDEQLAAGLRYTFEETPAAEDDPATP